MTDKPTGLARTAQIVRFLLKYRSSGVFTGLDADAMAPRDEDLPKEGKPEEFVSDLEALGPTFVKLGQALSTRPDMVPPAYIAALERMQDNVAPVPFDEVREVVESELGVRLSKAFASFDEEPLGGASLAQVHRATLRDGRAVAVKVQRPGIIDQLYSDLDSLNSVATRLDRATDIGRRVHFADWVHEFRKTLIAELDYRTEAENLERFGERFEPYPELCVPQPVWDYTRKRVLTMDLVTGIKVTEISGMRRTHQNLEDLAAALMRGYLDQVLVHGQIHADPHPGNLLLTPTGRLALFDLGMVAHIPPRQRDRLFQLLFAAVDGRGEDVVREAVAIGTRLEEFDEQRYQREVSQLVAKFAAHRSHSRGLSEGRLVLELTRLGTACGLRTPSEMSLLGKTLLNLEVVCDSLAPDLDIKNVIEGHLQNVMRDRMRQSMSPAKLAGEMMEMQALMRDAPRKISDVLGLLAENRMQFGITGLEESRLMENLQKIANRITAGLVTAALIISSALLMRVETQSQLFGYPTIAMVMFLIGSGLGLAVVINALVRDRRAPKREQIGPR
ncbi:ABC1 kinase family protein [Lysobacter korlensis]|uniref:ABC1 kinase family protein n=1 Tax=Lysobacter korlensis TaxID=553636 RepID=A0ABV6RMS4_9GAMM